jgi:hypothetical protein
VTRSIVGVRRIATQSVGIQSLLRDFWPIVTIAVPVVADIAPTSNYGRHVDPRWTGELREECWRSNGRQIDA